MVTDGDRNPPVIIQHLDEFNMVADRHRWFSPLVQFFNFYQSTFECYVAKQLSSDGDNYALVDFVILYCHCHRTRILD